MQVLKVNRGESAADDASDLRELQRLLDAEPACYMPHNSRPHARACLDLGERRLVHGLRLGGGGDYPGRYGRQPLWPSSRPRLVRVLAFPTADDFGGRRMESAALGAEPGYTHGAPDGHADEAAVVVGERLADDAVRDDQVRIAFPRPVEARYLLQIEWVDTYGKNFFAMDSLDIVTRQ
jgi:hypothetical protein